MRNTIYKLTYKLFSQVFWTYMKKRVSDDNWIFQSLQSYFYKRTNMRIFQHEGFTPIHSELLNSFVSGLYRQLSQHLRI
jgi:hypothetical protein